MNFAEGKGPKQAKKPYVLGQFVTIYGNDGTPGAVNPANPPYTPVVSGSTWNGGVVGSLNPGLNVSPSNVYDVSVICAPGSNESLQDLESTTAVLSPETGFSGSCVVSLQATLDRYTPNPYTTSPSGAYGSTNWITLGSVTVTGNGPKIINLAVSSGYAYPAYRLIASGNSATGGIIDWVLPNMFIDLSAQGVGQEANWINGSIGQPNIASPVSITISGGQTNNYSKSAVAYAATENNHDYIG